MSETPKLIELARIGAAQGLKGEVRVQSFCADPLALSQYGPLQASDGRQFEIESLRALKPAEGMLVVRFKGVGDRTAAEALNGLALRVPRERLPPPDEEDEFYHADLVGLLVRDGDGAEIGRVAALHNFGGGDVLELALAAGKGTAMVPFTRAAVPDVNPAEGYLVVEPMAAGLLDADEGPSGEGEPR